MPPASGERARLAELKRFLADHDEVVLSSGGASVVLPESVRGLFEDAVAVLEGGQAVTVEPHRTVLTTQEAAELLGITRPTLVRLLESGKIPFTSPGRHRRVELADVLEFQRGERVRRARVLEELASESEDPDGAGDGFVRTR